MTTKPMIEAAFGRPTKRKPIWFLRQAGRYLPEYREVRKNVEFTELCKTPKLAAEVTLQPLRRYDLDASIIFSDILVPCMPMGQELTFGKGHGPQLNPPIQSGAALAKLKKPDAEKDLGYVGEALQLVKDQLQDHQTMIGFAGAPFTVASYMIEGAGSKTYTELKRLRYQEPEAFKGLLDLLVETTIDYLIMQVNAGADCLMLFDTWANQMTAVDYKDLVFPAVNKVIREVKDRCDVPLIYYPGQGTDLYFELQGYAGDVIAVDWRTRLSRAISFLDNVGLDVSVQGNLDPQVLIASEDVVREHTRQVLQEAGKARGHIFNVGHGLQPHLNPEAVNWVIDEVRKSEKS
ncbi:uroporphyrinogen decarboxylase [Pseudobacteriovorax antillogorgiicola]|uniref:Uroporphyrinogen decarboxylase n=1 Tax=Pseudobacteriovorax antillogorgiicola TaxID=1513793 RepID=A0A1Y6C625_9BACT|nr:uroporphyrinogen decarboxylase [Pseudobacteriovorax antillogorgiicola]TCS49491.1 uroporphyrinogen decarboxylase [Pseudobacteriovorax antillogorgiicola]SMF45958.1 uroporphyrinogen decarboxylase [Pseudobacteriovorax antillogorgiicola]